MNSLCRKLLADHETCYRLTSVRVDDFKVQIISLFVRYKRAQSLSSGIAVNKSISVEVEEVRRKRLTEKATEEYLIFALYTRAKLSQNCIAALFGFSHRSSIRRRLREVVKFYRFIIRNRDRDSHKNNSRKRLAGAFQTDSLTLSFARLRCQRADTAVSLVRIPEEFYRLYPQLAGNKSTVSTSPPELKSSGIPTGREIASPAKQNGRFPEVTPVSYKTAAKALDLLVAVRWQGQPECPFCKAVKTYRLKRRVQKTKISWSSVRFKCAKCRR